MPTSFRSGAEVDGQPIVQLAVERAERLVEQEQAGLGRQRAGQRHPLRLAARQRRHAAALEAGQPDQGEQLGHPGRGSRPWAVRPPPGRSPTLAADVAVREELVVLEHEPEAPAVGGDVREVLARPSQHPAGVGARSAGDHPQQRALARSARARAAPPPRPGRRPGRPRRAPPGRRSGPARPRPSEHQNPAAARPAGGRRRGPRPASAPSGRWPARRPGQVERRSAGPSRRAMAMGMVSCPIRVRKLVAPNSPSEMAKANPAPATSARRRKGRSISRHTRAGRGAERRRGVPQAGVDGSQRREHGPHHERHGHDRVGDGDEHPGARAGRAGGGPW